MDNLKMVVHIPDYLFIFYRILCADIRKKSILLYFFNGVILFNFFVNGGNAMHERATVVMTIENYRIVKTGPDTYRLEYKRRFRLRDLFRPARRWKRIHFDFHNLMRLKVVLFNYADKKNKH